MSVDVLPCTVTWHGARFILDVGACRQGIVGHLLAEGQQLACFANVAGVSRMSLWRFMQGRQCSPTTVHAILAAAHIATAAVLLPITS